MYILQAHVGQYSTDSLSQRPSIQSRVAAGFSQFSKNTPKSVHHVHVEYATHGLLY